MYIKPIYLRILCASLLLLAVILNQTARHDIKDEQTAKYITRIANVIFALAIGLYIYFGSILGNNDD